MILQWVFPSMKRTEYWIIFIIFFLLDMSILKAVKGLMFHIAGVS